MRHVDQLQPGPSEAILGEVTSRWPRSTVITTKGGYAIDYIVPWRPNPSQLYRAEQSWMTLMAD